LTDNLKPFLLRPFAMPWRRTRLELPPTWTPSSGTNPVQQSSETLKVFSISIKH
jgi:hypothetical protein